MEYKGPKPSNADRVAVYSELGGGASNPYIQYVLSTTLTIPTDNSMNVAQEYQIRSSGVLTISDTAIFRIN